MIRRSGGSGSIEAVWERQEAGSGDWLPEVPARLLRIEQAAPEHTGLYRLNLESRWGVWKGPRVVAVNVISPPTNLCVRAESGACLAEGDSLEVDQLERLILSVEAEGTPEFTYQWYRTNDPISQEEGGQSPTLSVATEQAGVSWYQVHVTNSAGFLDTEQFEITVTNAKPNNVRIMLRGTPTVTDRKWIQTRQFDPLQLSVEADGAGPFRYQWYRSSQRVSEELGGNSATVTVATDQIGKHVYHVDVANDIDTATSKTFEIRVSICPDHLFQDSIQSSRPPTHSDDCSFKVAFEKAHSIARDEPVRSHTTLEDPEFWEQELISLAHLSLGDTAEAFRRVGIIESYGIREAMYRRISDWLAQRGNHSAALEATLRIDTVRERIAALNHIAVLQTTSRFEQEAQIIFRKAIKTTQDILDTMERNGAFGDIAIAQARAGDLDAALTTIARIEVGQERDDLPSFRDGVLFYIVTALTEAGDLELAERASAQLRHAGMRASSLSAVAVAYAEAGHEAEAVAILERAISVADDLKGKKNKFSALRHLSVAQYRLGDGEKAERTLEERLEEVHKIDDLEIQDFAWINIAIAKAAMGNMSGALDVVDRLDGRTAQAMASLSVEMAWLGHIQYLVQKENITEALELSQQILDQETQLGALRFTAGAQSRFGDREGARSAFARILDIVESIEDWHSRNFQFMNLLHAQSRNGFIGEAIRNANRKDRTNAYDPYRRIGKGILDAINDENVQVGDIVTAIDAAHAITDYSARIAILAGIAALSGRTTQ